MEKNTFIRQGLLQIDKARELSNNRDTCVSLSALLIKLSHRLFCLGCGFFVVFFLVLSLLSGMRQIGASPVSRQVGLAKGRDGTCMVVVNSHEAQ